MNTDTRYAHLPIIERLKLKVSCASEVYNLFKDLPYSFFLDSALAKNTLGRYSFIGAEPFLVFRSKKDRIVLDWIKRREVIKGNPFSALKGLLKQFRMDPEKRFPFPFVGGGVGYFSYDLKDFNETLPDMATDDLGMPGCIFSFYDCILIFDHSKEEYFIASSGFPETGRKRLYRQRARLENLKNRIHAGIAHGGRPGSSGVVPGRDLSSSAIKLKANFTRDSFIRAIGKAKEYIKAGDIYQVNLSQRFNAKLDADPFELYKVLRSVNPAPFAAFLNFGGTKIVSASPERFLKKDGKYLETRPIKGTRPRGNNDLEDLKLKKELTLSVKDRAENLMIIDLERNDLGRICKYGSVHVSKFMTCEKYATVFHLVSTVEGELRDGVDSIDCLVNCFPGGSITGAPKIRSMEIIEELEPVKRGVYTGSIGYIGFNDNMDTSIAIRTIVVKGRDAYFQVGGGIVYDSDPEKEYQETLDKAKALIHAISVIKGRSKVCR
ncbi:MAG: aminodeoxychorismate synthase component I [Candidatus Omnitrophota bacterium]